MPRRGYVLRVLREDLARALDLPSGAYVEAMNYDIESDAAEFRVCGAGWPVAHGFRFPVVRWGEEGDMPQVGVATLEACDA